MKNKVGFLGIGAAGSNICEIAELYGYRTSVINTSPEDLAAIQLIQNKLLVGKQGGAGKDRRIAKGEVKGNFQEIAEFVADKFKEIELIYVVFSTGGGTGSGMGPIIIDLLKKFVPNKTFGGIVILPSKSESAVAQANNIECVRELVALEIPGFCVDNEKAASMFPNLSRKSLYDTVNNHVMDQFNAFLITERTPSKYGNLDSKDRLKLLCTGGNTIIATAEIDFNADGMTIQKQIIESLNNSLFAPLEYDGVVRRIGFIYELDDKATKDATHEQIVREVGKPLEVFEGFYKPSKDGKNTVVTILAGLSYPEDRIADSKKVLESSKDDLSIKREYNVLTEVDTGWFSGIREETTVKKSERKLKDEADLEDLWSKYD